MKYKYRSLSLEEISQLTSNGNYADDWSEVCVADPFFVSAVRGNVFSGKVEIGPIEPKSISDGDLSLPEGLTQCRVGNCRIGAHSALHNVRVIYGYEIGDGCLLFNIDEMTCNPSGIKPLEPMNECGGRRIVPFEGMRVADAYLWAKYRGNSTLMRALEEMTPRNVGKIGNGCVIKNTRTLRNVSIQSSADAPSRVEDCVVVSDGVVGFGCKLEYGCIAERFLLGENVKLENGVRLTDTVVGDNSTIACCEVGNNMIFPAHEQHHNNSFLIASLVKGQSNVAAGCTIGSNHNGRTADNEIVAGRGFWPGLCCSFKHSSRFASYCLLAKGDYPYELDISLPFALVSNNVSANRLEVMPAYWWMYNMYALDRNSRKFAARDKRYYSLQHVEFSPLAPDSVEEILHGMELLTQWTSRSSEGMVTAEGLENSHRKTMVLKPHEAMRAYEDMLIYYAMQQFGDDERHVPTTKVREQRWVNLGGQLIKGTDFEQLIADIEQGFLASWDEIHARYDLLWERYREDKKEHAYQVLCALLDTQTLSDEQWTSLRQRYASVCEYVKQQVRITREKDAHNVFRRMTYDTPEEMSSVLD